MDWILTPKGFPFVVVAIVVVGLGIKYLFALVGEPQSLWLMRDVLGLI